VVAVGKLPMDVSVKIGERGPDFVKLSSAVLVRRAARLRGVVEKIVGEELLEHRKIPAALHFFRIAPDHRFRGIAAGHDLPPCTSAIQAAGVFSGRVSLFAG
jgi:hypothetical protein